MAVDQMIDGHFFYLRSVKNLTLAIVAIGISISSLAQVNLDSLEKAIEGRNIDTTLIADYLALASGHMNEDSTKTMYFIDEALQASESLKNRLWKGRSLFKLGQYHVHWGRDLEKTAYYYQLAVDLFRKENADLDELVATMKLGTVYTVVDQDDKAFELYRSSLERHPQDDRYGMIINNSIGVMMKSIGESRKALGYMDRSEEFFERLRDPDPVIIDKQISNDKNRGVLYRNIESFDTAEFYLDRALQRAIEENDSLWIARVYNSIGLMYEKQQLYLQAVDAFSQSLDLKRAQNYTDGVITSLTNIGALYIKMGDYTKAKTCLEEADLLCEMSNMAHREVNVLKELSELYYKTGKPRLAYEKLHEFIELSDSLEELTNSKYKQELEAQYQNNVLAAEEDKLKAELAAADLREETRTAELKQQKTFMVLGISFTVVLLILVVITIRSNIKRKTINNELSGKNVEITQKSVKIENQKHQIEEKNQEMMDSINYAKRIQNAILPNHEFFKKHLPASFIYYEPKDVLAGDFYWMDVVDDIIIWAAADCTGHGIPGAMVSVVCHNAMNRSIHEFGHTVPGKILDSTRDLVIETFEKSGMEVNDGMDIALCCYNKKTNSLQFAGANNPLWLIRPLEGNGTTESDFIDEEAGKILQEFRGDKQPVGRHYVKSPFRTHQVDVQKGDQLFLFTDGFADQFGGDKGKKLKYKNFKKLILQHSVGDIQEHGNKISEAFSSWKGDFEQLDDVCVIGVKI